MKINHLLLIILNLIITNTWATGLYHCPGDCRVFNSSKSYPNLVVGIVKSILSFKNSTSFYEDGKVNGNWKTLAAAPHEFAKLVRPVVIQSAIDPESPAFIMLMGEDEYSASPIKPGDLVRYSPHDAQHPQPSEGTKAELELWDLYGCIAVLCNAENASCHSQYRQGLFSKKTGMRLTYSNELPMTSSNEVIDPMSMLPIEPMRDATR